MSILYLPSNSVPLQKDKDDSSSVSLLVQARAVPHHEGATAEPSLSIHEQGRREFRNAGSWTASGLYLPRTSKRKRGKMRNLGCTSCRKPHAP